jgi:hypothetical protein
VAPFTERVCFAWEPSGVGCSTQESLPHLVGARNTSPSVAGNAILEHAPGFLAGEPPSRGPLQRQSPVRNPHRHTHVQAERKQAGGRWSERGQREGPGWESRGKDKEPSKGSGWGIGLR